MITGISTACLYPLETEKALDILLNLGFKTFELFLNCDSEVSQPYLKKMHECAQANKADFYSMHFYSAAYESFMFFTEYQRRFDDGAELYRRYFASAAQVGAKVVVFHGDRRRSTLPIELFCERFYQLSQMARKEGVILAQENVMRCRSGELAELQKIHRLLGSDIKFTLDIKQAVRAQENLFEMLREMGPDIVNVHVSDNTPEYDCLVPGVGSMDFKKLISSLQGIGYVGPLVIEVYRTNFKEYSELAAAGDFLRQMTGEVSGLD